MEFTGFTTLREANTLYEMARQGVAVKYCRDPEASYAWVAKIARARLVVSLRSFLLTRRDRRYRFFLRLNCLPGNCRCGLCGPRHNEHGRRNTTSSRYGSNGFSGMLWSYHIYFTILPANPGMGFEEALVLAKRMVNRLSEEEQIEMVNDLIDNQPAIEAQLRAMSI